MSSSTVPNDLLMAPYQLNIYFGLFVYITGFIGSIGNIIVYRSKSMANRACSIYLFWESVVDLIYLTFVMLTRILMKGFRISITSRYDILCRIRQFSSSYGNQLAFTFLALATLDRIFLAQRSPSYRRWGNRIPLAKKLVVASFIFWIAILFPRLVWYRTANGSCGPEPGFYAYFDNIYTAIVTCLLPMIILTTLGIIIGQSIRQVIQRQAALTSENSESTHGNQSVISRIDAQLTIMLFLEVFVAMISFLPYAANLIYANITSTWPKSPLQNAWETVISEIINILSYFFFSCPFYVSILSFSGFRQQLLRSLGLMKHTHDTQSHTRETTTMRNIQNTNNTRIHPNLAQ